MSRRASKRAERALAERRANYATIRDIRFGDKRGYKIPGSLNPRKNHGGGRRK